MNNIERVMIKLVDERCEAINSVHEILIDISFFVSMVGSDKIDEWKYTKDIEKSKEAILSYINYKKMAISSIILPIFDSANEVLSKAKDMKIDEYVIHMRTFLGEENKVSRQMLHDAEKYIAIDTNELLESI